MRKIRVRKTQLQRDRQVWFWGLIGAVTFILAAILGGGKYETVALVLACISVFSAIKWGVSLTQSFIGSFEVKVPERQTIDPEDQAFL